MWFLKAIGWLALGIVGLVVAAVMFDEDKSSAQLEVRTKPDPIFGAFPVLSVKNVGREPITILEATANDRPECRPEFVPKEPLVLKVGESGVASSKCEIIRTKIKTDKGTSEYTFRERR